MRRSATLRRTKPMKRKGRSKAETLRVYGPPERRRWVKAQPCVFCVALSSVFALVTGHCQQAHVETGGMGRKSDYTRIVPLCASHHKRYDEHQAPFHVEVTREYVRSMAPVIEAAWQRHQRSIIDALHTTDPLCVTCQASFRETGDQCASCACESD